MTDLKTDPATSKKPSFFRRIPLAFGAFFRIFSDADYATRIGGVDQQAEPVPVAPAPAPVPAEPVKAAVPPLKELSPDAALQLLSMLQREARLIDFIMEDLSAYSDAEIGTAARVVHEGCRKVVDAHFSIEPVRAETEGARITLNEGFDAAAIRLTGNVAGKAPFHGSLSHRGWRVTDVRLPKLTAGHDASVLAPAEVEL
jgi:hypothetical protein